MLFRILTIAAGLIALCLLAIYALGSGALGTRWEMGDASESRVSAAVVDARRQVQESARQSIGVAKPAGAEEPKQILFGDLHVHSTFSLDAFIMALPATGGDGARPVSDACDFARFCSDLDFWSINDHALSATPRSWRETVDSIRQCNDVAGDPSNPDLTTFLGWEWTQMGTTPDNHYGHKNVILRGLADEDIPTRPIAARPPADAYDRQPKSQPGTLLRGMLGVTQPGRDTNDLLRYFADMLNQPQCPDGVPVRELSEDCHETTSTPAGLFAKLDEWGFDSMVIPHGTTWGLYTPHGSSWDKQLVGDEHDADRQPLIEVYSGHGNSEEYRDWQEVVLSAGGASCPEPVEGFLPSCWRAGEIIHARCIAAGETEATCSARAAEARLNYIDADVMGHLTVPGTHPDEWLDADQCTDCFQPSLNYRPKSSVQYIMALRNFDDPANPRRFEFGFIASSDNHSSRPGTGYKEYARTQMTEAPLVMAGARMMGGLPQTTREAVSKPFAWEDFRGAFFALREAERATSFFVTGGLVAVHSQGRDRDSIWNAMEQKEVYGTSGPRILLWFDLLNPPGSRGTTIPMGGEASMSASPIFQVRAVGSFEQEPGCPDSSLNALDPARIDRLCRGECYNPSDQRRAISRIEVVRIRPQIRHGEPVADLIEDPWRVLDCDPDPTGCAATFTDPDFQTSGRDALYYVRAIETPSPAVNADNLRCERDETGRCISVHACLDVPNSDDCLADTEQRAWSSPIFLANQAR